MGVYIVTGGAGFIGSGVAKRLAAKNNKVYIIDDLSTGFERNLPKDAIFYRADIVDFQVLSDLKIPDKIDAVFHLAAQASGEASFDDPARDVDVNYKATYNMLRLAEMKDIKRFIYASSMSVYGAPNTDDCVVFEDSPCNPSSYYGCNKLASEKLINVFTKKSGVIPTIFRFFNVYGPGQNMLNMKQGMVSIYMEYLLKGETICVKGALDRFRDFIFIDDVVDVLLASEKCEGAYKETFNLGTGTMTTVKDLISAMLKAYGKESFDQWVNVEGNTPGDIRGCVANIRKLKDALDWKPKYQVMDGMKKMQKWTSDTIRWWTAENE